MDRTERSGSSSRRAGRAVFPAVGLGMLLGALLSGCASTPSGGSAGARRLEPLPAGGYQRLVEQSSSPVVLLFRSANCSYCKGVASHIDEDLAKGKPWVVYAVDIHQEPRLRHQFQVGAVPCLVFLRNGQEVDRNTGWRPFFAVRGKLDRFFR